MNISELDPETLARLGLTHEIKKERKYTFNKDHVRSHSMTVMGCISKLSQSERKRVLQHCLKINDI